MSEGYRKPHVGLCVVRNRNTVSIYKFCFFYFWFPRVLLDFTFKYYLVVEITIPLETEKKKLVRNKKQNLKFITNLIQVLLLVSINCIDSLQKKKEKKN